jgi:hypothetical protein
MMRTMVRALVVAALAALALAQGASAAAPTLVSVTQSGGRVSARWTLPPGGATWTVEVAKAPAVDEDGYFLADNVVDAQVFFSDTSVTSWTSDETLPAGTYYVHLSGADQQCATCPVPEWSAVKSVTVGGSTGSGSAVPTAPGSTGATGGSTEPAPTTPTTPSSGPSDDGDAATPTATPTTAFGTVSKAKGTLKGTLELVSFSVCGSGDVDVTVTVARGKATHVAVVTLPLSGCTSYSLRLSVPPGTAKPTVSVGTGAAALRARR